MKAFTLKDLIKKILTILLKSDKPKISESPLINSSITQQSTRKNMNNVTKVIHKREKESEDTILGTWYLDGKEICKTLENGWKDNKPKISCIPTGTYNCTRDYTGKFQYWKINNVPNRSNIEIHNGNTHNHTLGCLIIGSSWGRLNDKPAVLGSLTTLNKLKQILPDEFELEIS